MMVEKSPKHHVKEAFFLGLSQFSKRAVFEKSEATPTAW